MAKRDFQPSQRRKFVCQEINKLFFLDFFKNTNYQENIVYNKLLSCFMLRLVALPFAIFALASCQKNPEIPEPDSLFQREKKRPEYNENMISKSNEYDSEYQEPSFLNDPQSTPYNSSNENYNTNPYTVQQIRSNAEDQSFSQYQQPYQEKKNHYDEKPAEQTQPSVEQIQPSIPQPKSQEFSTPQSYSPPSHSTPTTTTSTETGEYELQAGAYRNEAGAKSTIEKLESAGVKNVRLDDLNGNYVIRITDDIPLNTRAEASQFLQKVIDQSHHYDIMVIKR